VYLVYKVHKLVKWTDLPMLLSILSITLALIFLLVFCIIDMVSMTQPPDAWLNTKVGSQFTEAFDDIKIMLMFTAFLFDLYKWCIFLAVTRQSKADSLSEEKAKMRQKNL
jgi:hypothetical protein